MKRITKGTDNTVVFTLNEKRCYVSPYYAIGIYDEQNDVWSYFLLGSYATDESTDITRFNQFTINEPNDIEFPEEGFYSYLVWEIPTDELPEDLGPERTEGRLEAGRIKVVGEQSDEAVYDNNADEKTYTNAGN